MGEEVVGEMLGPTEGELLGLRVGDVLGSKVVGEALGPWDGD